MHHRESPAFFSFGDWTVRPALRSIERRDERHVLEPKLIDVLTYLAGTGGAVVSADQLLTDCWRGRFYGDNPVHKTVALLRKALHDDARAPRYIATVRKRGYQVVAVVAFDNERNPGVAPTRNWQEGSPFRGLLAFGSEDAAVFFGRARATADVLAAIHRQHASGCAFVLVTGPSGSGKSSLAHAGVIPALMREAGYDGLRAAAWSSFSGRSPDIAPIDSLALAMTRWEVRGRPVFVETERAALSRALIADPDFVLRRIALSLDDRGDILLLVLDTLEGVLAARGGPAAVAGLIRVLALLARSGHVAVVALCRNDFYPPLMAIPELLALKRDGHHHDLAMPSPGEVAQMIRLPAQRAGLSFERDTASERQLDDVLLDAACRERGSLPLLQYTLQALYEARDARGMLTFAAYQALGGIEGALARRADQVFAGLDDRQIAVFPRFLQRVVALSADGDEVTARIVRWRDLADDEGDMLRAFVDARLLVSLLEDDEPCFTVGHEALLRHWPRVVAWIGTHRDMLRTRARIADMARRWSHDDRRGEHLLPRGQLLTDARTLVQQAQPPLAEHEQRFVRRSLWQARVRSGILFAMSTVIAALAVVSSMAAVDARRAERHAETRRADAEGLLDFMLGDMYERLDALGRLDLLDEVTRRAMLVLGRDWQVDVPDAVLRQARALRQVGEIRYARGNLEGAAQAFLASDASLHHLFDDATPPAAAFAERGKLDFWRAQIASGHGHADEALAAWNDYLRDASQRATLEPDVPDAWLELSYAYNCLGSAALRADKLDEAVSRFAASVALKQRVLGMQPTDSKTWLELADTASWMAIALQQRGDLRTALQTLEEERRAVSAAREPGEPTSLWLYRRALAELHVARAQADLGMPAEANASYTRAADRFANLVRDTPDNRTWQRDLAWARTQQGWLAFGLGDDRLAMQRLVEGERMFRTLLTVNAGMADWRTLLAQNLIYLSAAHLRSNDPDKALSLATEAATLLARPAGSKPGSTTRMLLAVTQTASGEALVALGQRAEAADAWQRGADALRALATDSADPRMLDPYVHVLLLLGHTGEAAITLERLHKAGYRQPAFESFVHSSPTGRSTP